MNPSTTPENRQVNHRRRKPSKLKIFKEAYLPPILALGVVVLIVVFIMGAISNANNQKQAALDASIAESIAQQEAYEALLKQAEALMDQAEKLAAMYDYDGALAILEKFTGNRSEFANINTLWQIYTEEKNNLIVWNNLSKIPNLSFQLLIADSKRAFNDPTYKNSFNRNFVTTEEFSEILTRLYDNGYILVSLDDIAEQNGAGYAAKELLLPAGKKPLLLTQTNVNYSLYLVDSDGDMFADKNGCGFASKLVVDANGNLSCEMVDANGNTVTGAYDLVPILEDFIERHPDFSYRGARAILALTGYNGLFGYRTHGAAKEKLGEAAYAQEIADAKAVAEVLTEKGYNLACYTYANIGYGTRGLAAIQADLSSWKNEVTPILGQLDTFVFAQSSDLAVENTYSGPKFQALQEAGFHRYLGFSANGTPWATLGEDYVGMGRLLVGGENIRNHPDWFEGIFDCTELLNR
ncbi:MAG: hypothetical protein E7435_02900 [Ruminococcaceae bacterium]|nr:hypothetical protein [Oscillospiraceae bacterium]